MEKTPNMTPAETFNSLESNPILGKVHQQNDRVIKFQVPPSFTVPESLGTLLSPRVFTSTYFDSTHHRLGQLGMTLRKRVERGQSAWQLKIPSGEQHIELEVESGSRRIPSQLLDLLIAFFRHEEPMQIGKIRVWRTRVCVQRGQRKVAELTLDSVALMNNNKIISRFQELALQSKGGGQKHLKDLRRTLEKSGGQLKPLRPKIFQALHLSFPLQPKLLGSTTPIPEHIQGHLSNQLRQMLLHDPGTRLGRDMEALHQMRVATRRMRALLRTASPFLIPKWSKPVRREVRWIGSLLGKVRDFDVLLENFSQQFSDLPEKDRRGLTWILTTFENQRSIARAKLLEGLRSDRYLQFLDDLENSLIQIPQRPTTLTLIDVTRKSIHKLFDAIAQSHVPAHSEELHRIRILLKRSRYAIELSAPFLGKIGKSFLQQAKRTQELLGHVQDTIVGEQRILEIQTYRPPNSVRFVSGMMIERLRTIREQLYLDIPKHWKKLNKLGNKV